MPPFSLFFASLCLLLIGSSFGEDNHLKKEELQPKVSRPDVAICEGSISAFFVSDNMNIRGANATAVIRGVNEKQCTDFCVHNQDHKGRTVLCASAVYESEAQECQLFRQASFPDGQMERKAEEGRRYFEKFCLPEEAPVDCANRQFVRVDDYILKGYAQSTTTVSTMADCVAYCMREREFECKSAMFFYEEGECITNLESAITAPDDFQRPDDEDKVIFFHNGCILPGAGSAPPQDGHFEVAQSQDSLKSTATASSALTAGGEESAERAIQQSPSSPSQSTTSSPPPSSSSTPPAAEPTPAEEPESPQSSIIGSNGPAPQQPPSITAESPAINSSTQLAEIASTPPDRADEIPAAVDNTKVGEEEQRKEKEEEESEEDGQKLEESAAAHQPLLGGAAAEEPEAGDGPKAVPVPPAETERLETEQQQQQPRVHPKQLALAGQQEQQQRQYGAKTIERAPDGSFQEKVAEVAGSVNPVADGSSSSPSAIAKGPSNRKGPESTKRLQLKLIKDQQQQPKPDILSVTLAPPQPAAQPSLPTSLGPSASPSSPPPPLPSTRQPTQPASPASNIAPGRVAEDGQTAAEDEQQAEQSAEERFEGTEGYFSRWGQWTPCQVPGERRVRRRKCLDLRRCKGALMQVDYCPRDIPPPPPPSDEQEALGDAAQAPAAEEQRQPQPPLNRPVLHGQPQAEVLPAAPEAPSRQPLTIDLSRVAPAEGQPPAIMPPSQDQQENQKPQPLPAGAPAPRPPTPIEEEVAIWSAWNGTCQHFASSQPCKDGQVIGFESRECVAKDPLACKGPFFRYCVLPC